MISLSGIVCNILQDEDYVQLAQSHSRKKKISKKSIHERRFLLRERGAAKYLHLKMTGHGFGVGGAYMGIRAHHNFVGDPELAGYCVMARCIPCICLPCKNRFQLPVNERYKNPCDDCHYWEMYRGLNDWKQIRFEPTAKCDGDELMDSQAFTLKGVGMKDDVEIDGFGAYSADGKCGYYLVKWTKLPWIIKKSLCVGMR